MNFLKNFFNDESGIVGLCGFETLKPKYNQNTVSNEFFFNAIQQKDIFKTDFSKNILLI